MNHLTPTETAVGLHALPQTISQTDGRKIEGCFVAGQGLRFLRPVGWMMLTGGQTDRMLTRLSLTPQETSQTSLETDGPDLAPPAPPPELQQVYTHSHARTHAYTRIHTHTRRLCALGTFKVQHECNQLLYTDLHQ